MTTEKNGSTDIEVTNAGPQGGEMDLLEENKMLKEQLRDREARLMAMQQAINTVLSNVTTDSNTLYKEINKNLVILSDTVKGYIEPQLQQTFTAIRTQIPPDKKKELCYQFRKEEGLPPLE